MDEEHEHGDVDEKKPERDCDREMGHEVGAGAARHGSERKHRIDERCHERAERQLCPSIAYEVS
jgi:hypothetical protein